MTLKKCVGCGDVKPATLFPVQTSYGRAFNRCHECKNASSAATYRRHRDEANRKGKAYAKKRRIEHGDKLRADDNRRKKEWRKANPDYYYRHLELNRKRQREWRRKFRRENPEAARARDRRYLATKNAKRRGAVGKVDPVDYDFIKQRDRMKCHICKKKVAQDDVHIDHVIPLSKGGRHEESNLAVSHKACNMSKFNKVLTLF